MVCEIAHFGYNGATVCIPIHPQFSAPMRKSPPIHFCTYDQNHRSLSPFSRSLSHFYRGDADLSESVEPAQCLQHNTHYDYVVHKFPVITQKLYFETCILQILLTSERERR